MANTDGAQKRIDWAEAEAFYLALDPPRVLQRVVEKFAVSRVTVGRQAKRREWREKAARIDAEAAERAHGKRVRDRSEQIAQMARIRDAAADRMEKRLLSDEELEAAIVVRALEMAEKYVRLDAGEATDKIAVAEVSQLILGVYRAAGEFVAKERREEFVRRLDDASSGMLALGEGEGA